ncbi:hypothetical protein [Methanosarcina mazei]|nr:hypothetical protein [Methanosarcina mazei]AKB72191.1 hypothetical protein MSMAC_2301 [Methanosarcina mazei C16]MDO5839983.1 hypothetical protein [Methanosarcina mazei]
MEINLTENFDLIGILQIAIILISAIIYYFGVRWGETNAEEYSAASHYFAGVLFVINYLLKPYFLILIVEFFVKNYTSYYSDLTIFKLEIDSFWVFFLYLLIVFVEYVMHKIVHLSTKRFVEKRKLLDEFEFRDCQKINQCEQFILLNLIPFLVITITYGFYKTNAPFEIILPSFIIAFLTFTNLAFCAGYCNAHYSKSVLYLKNGMVIDGIILKYGSYVYVLTKNKTCLINRDDICTIKVNENSKKLCCDYFTVAYKKLTSFFGKL